MDDRIKLKTEETLPKDKDSAVLIGRVWIPGELEGPSPVWVKDEKIFDLSNHFPTISHLLEMEDPAMTLRGLPELKVIGIFKDLLNNL